MLQTTIVILVIIVAVIYLIHRVIKGKCHKGCTSCPLYKNCTKEEKRKVHH